MFKEAMELVEDILEHHFHGEVASGIATHARNLLQG
jgi:hypothetical protein